MENSDKLIDKAITHSVLHKANTRGHANHGWLESHHTFSFANYHNPDRMNFGALRVLNDDRVNQGMGFGEHPHDNMEIISIPLEGDLEHQDSMGNTTVIKQGDIQVMIPLIMLFVFLFYSTITPSLFINSMVSPSVYSLLNKGQLVNAIHQGGNSE